MTYPRIASLKTPAQFRDHLAASGIDLPFDESLLPHAQSPLATPIMVDGMRVGNRFCVLPMEGWDGTADGHPSDLTRRRWRHFGISGAKLIWGGEAVAVRHDGRANPHQLLLTHETQHAIERLRTELVSAHRERFGGAAEADLAVGLQLTHSGRFSRPDSHQHPKPLTACPRPVLDRRFPQGVHLLDDGAIERLVLDFVKAAKLAREAGFAFIDFKHCHGYFAHELLGARSREGRFGGSLENRMRFTREVIRGVHAEAPGLKIVVRLSVFDTVPFRKGPDGIGEPEPDDSDAGFGLLRNDDMEAALHDAREAIAAMHLLGVRAICVTAGTPYYNPHVLRPATFPPVDGYEPPEDPLRGVARHVDATARLKAAFPDVVFVGSGYSYLQEWLPHVAQHTVARGMTDLVGLGRQMLSYPEFAADVLAGRPLKRKHLCRTFSDCTTGPRIGVVSGCYPLDAEYLERPDAARIRDLRTHRTGSPA